EDFYVVRKIYCPVQILTDSLRATLNECNDFQIGLENRFDFKPLSGYSLHWQLVNLNRILQTGTVYLTTAAKSKDRIQIQADLPGEVALSELTLRLAVLDPDGKQINEKYIPLLTHKTDYKTLILNRPATK